MLDDAPGRGPASFFPVADVRVDDKPALVFCYVPVLKAHQGHKGRRGPAGVPVSRSTTQSKFKWASRLQDDCRGPVTFHSPVVL